MIIDLTTEKEEELIHVKNALEPISAL